MVGPAAVPRDGWEWLPGFNSAHTAGHDVSKTEMQVALHTGRAENWVAGNVILWPALFSGADLSACVRRR